MIKVKVILLTSYYFEIMFQNSNFENEGTDYVKFICRSIVIGPNVTECMSNMAVSGMKMILNTESSNELTGSLKAEIIKNLVLNIIDSESEEFFDLITFIVT